MKTVNKLIDGFIDLQKSLGIIGENEKDTYIYAYTILFEQVLNIFIAIVIGSMMGALGFVGVFLLFYIPLRILGGGYHADSGSNACSGKCGNACGNTCVDSVASYKTR